MIFLDVHFSKKKKKVLAPALYDLLLSAVVFAVFKRHFQVKDSAIVPALLSLVVSPDAHVVRSALELLIRLFTFKAEVRGLPNQGLGSTQCHQCHQWHQASSSVIEAFPLLYPLINGATAVHCWLANFALCPNVGVGLRLEYPDNRGTSRIMWGICLIVFPYKKHLFFTGLLLIEREERSFYLFIPPPNKGPAGALLGH